MALPSIAHEHISLAPQLGINGEHRPDTAEDAQMVDVVKVTSKRSPAWTSVSQD
jgi:hypothetical protein